MSNPLPRWRTISSNSRIVGPDRAPTASSRRIRRIVVVAMVRLLVEKHDHTTGERSPMDNTPSRRRIDNSIDPYLSRNTVSTAKSGHSIRRKIDPAIARVAISSGIRRNPVRRESVAYRTSERNRWTV